MKTLWLLALASAPLAILTVWGVLDSGAGGAPIPTDTAAASSALSVLQKHAATAAAHREAADALKQLDPSSPGNPSELENLPADGPLAPLRRSGAAWNTASSLVEAFLRAVAAEPPRDVSQLRAAEEQWENLQKRLAEAKPAIGDAMTSLAAQRLTRIRQKIARWNAENEAVAAANDVKDAFAAGNHQACSIQARKWIDTHAGAAPASLAEEMKALALRAEFAAERERSRTRLKFASSAAEQEAVLAAFIERFADAPLTDDDQRAVLEQCRQSLEKLRGEAAAAKRGRIADEAVRARLAHLPAAWEDRLAFSMGILGEHPLPTVRAALRGRVREWLAEALPEKLVDEPPDLCEAETRDGRVLRGYFVEVLTHDGLVGYKRYDTAAQRDRPTFDVGTWLAGDLASPPGVSVPRRLVQAYHDARKQLLDSPGRKTAWDAFAAACERLQAQADAYRAKPGGATRVPDFRSELEFARRTVSGTALGQLEAIWQTTEQKQ